MLVAVIRNDQYAQHDAWLSFTASRTKTLYYKGGLFLREMLLGRMNELLEVGVCWCFSSVSFVLFFPLSFLLTLDVCLGSVGR